MVFLRRGARQRPVNRAHDTPPDDDFDAGPSEVAEIESLHGDILREDEVDSLYLNVDDVVEDAESSFNFQIFISLAVFAAAAVYFTVQRVISAMSGENRREQHPRKALVLRLPSTAAHKNGRGCGMTSPDNNLTFVVPEDFKLGFVEAAKTREAWQRVFCFIPDDCYLVDELLRGGAQCLGKAWTEPIPFNLIESGNEIFRNPHKPGTITGGEYSGCAVLVGASEADFALAVDTVGSARIAAACCGIICFKPTLGPILLNGISVKSSALDTVSFMTKQPQYLSRIGELMHLPGNSNWKENPVTIYIAKDVIERWLQSDNKEMAYAVTKAAFEWATPDQVEEVDLGEFLAKNTQEWEYFDPDDIYEALRKAAITIAGHELKCKMLKDCNAPVEESSEEAEKYHKALTVRRSVQESFKLGIRNSKLVILPALLRPPPNRNANAEELKEFELETQRLHALSSLVGCPQIIYPIQNKYGALYSISIISQNKTDRQLLAISEKLIPLTYQMLEAQILHQMHRRQQQLEQPAERAQQRLSEANQQGEVWREIGRECFRSSEFEKAVVAYTEAINCCPYKAVFYTNRAMAYIRLLQFEDAEEDCSKALMIEANDTKALYRRGVARKKLRMYIEAQQDFEKVLSIEPNNRPARTELRELERIFCQE